MLHESSVLMYVFPFQQSYGHNPFALYHIVKHCLHQETTLLQKAELVSAWGIYRV